MNDVAESRKKATTNYIADREQAPQWVCFENGRTVGIAWENGKPYLAVGWEHEGERRLRYMAVAEDEAGSINIGDPKEAEQYMCQIVAEAKGGA